MVCIVVAAIKQHFQSAFATRSHPDTFSIDTHFLRPAGPGEVVVIIKDITPGSSVTTIHFTLVQDGIERIAGYASNTNLDLERGVSYPTPSPLDPSPPPADLAKLADQSDPNWTGYSVPWHPNSFLKAITHLQYFSPVKSFTAPNISDTWIRFATLGQRFTTEMLGSVADHWLRMIENYVPDSVWRKQKVPEWVAQAHKKGRPILAYSTSYGYPTLSMHLEIKRKLPAEGTEWLFMRAQTTSIRNGRFDAEVTILDEEMQLIAISHQLVFITKGKQVPDTPKAPRESNL
ncbi:MAG: hypothetical protein Q9169_000782 [Polycauliona sp. 2 TL-2023]